MYFKPKLYMAYNVLEINAALCNLTNQKHIVSSAEEIIQFALRHTPHSSFISMEYYGSRKNTNSFTATTEYGNVGFIEEDDKPKEYSYGIHKKRIGNFKLWRVGHSIYFHDFWKSDRSTIATDELEVIEYCIKCTRSFAFKKFGYIENRLIFSFCGYSIIRPDFIELNEKED